MSKLTRFFAGILLAASVAVGRAEWRASEALARRVQIARRVGIPLLGRMGGGGPASISAGAIPTSIDPTTPTPGPAITCDLFAAGCACAVGATTVATGGASGAAGEDDANVKQKGPPQEAGLFIFSCIVGYFHSRTSTKCPAIAAAAAMAGDTRWVRPL